MPAECPCDPCACGPNCQCGEACRCGPNCQCGEDCACETKGED